MLGVGLEIGKLERVLIHNMVLILSQNLKRPSAVLKVRLRRIEDFLQWLLVELLEILALAS